jgi:hypothetical protein
MKNMPIGIEVDPHSLSTATSPLKTRPQDKERFPTRIVGRVSPMERSERSDHRDSYEEEEEVL